MSCWPPSPCDRLSRSPRRARHRPRLLRGLRPTATVLDPEPESSHLDPNWLPGRDERSRRMVPTFTRSSIGQGGAQLYSGSIATATPQTFTVASWPLELNGFGVEPTQGSCAAHRPISTRLEPASRLRSVHHWFAYAAPSDLTRRARTVWQYQHDSPSRGRLPPITVVPSDRLPRRFIRPLRRPNRDGLSPPLDTPGASWRTAPSRSSPRRAAPPHRSQRPSAPATPVPAARRPQRATADLGEANAATTPSPVWLNKK